MIRLAIHEAETHLSACLAKLDEGEAILLCKRNVPIAEIRPLRQQRAEPRSIGLARDTFEAPDRFFEPLPDDLPDLFEGRGE